MNWQEVCADPRLHDLPYNLEEIATRKELSAKVVREQLAQGMVSMAKLLP